MTNIVDRPPFESSTRPASSTLGKRASVPDAIMSFTPLFYALLKLYHTFPLHSPVTLLYMDAPWGRFAYNQQRGREGRRAWGDLDGNLAWAFMEIVSVSRRSCEQHGR